MTAPVFQMGKSAVIFFFLFGVLLMLCCPAFAGTMDFKGLEDLRDSYDVSSNGSVVVGRRSSPSGTEAFRWTHAGGIVDLGDLPGGAYYSSARGVSSNGSVVVGYSYSASGYQAFRWTQAGGMVGLGDLPGGSFYSLAYGVNSDGSVVVGYSSSASGPEAFRWTQASGMVGLGDLPGGSFLSAAYGVSSDGSVVVGTSRSASGWEAFRWTQAGGMVGLGDLPGGSFFSAAYDVSSDGSVVVGYSSSASGSEAFRWTQAGGMVGLGDLPGGSFYSLAYGTSSDGSVVVGTSKSASGDEAFRWTADTGMQSLKDQLVLNGVDMTGWTLREARAVSDDGTTIVGYGTNPIGDTSGYIARSQGLITPAALNTSLSTMSQVYTIATSMAQTSTSAMMDASHGAVLNTTSGLSSGDEINGRIQLWVVGLLISDRDFSGEDTGGEGGVGVTHYLANGLSVGGGVFSGKRSLDTAHEGNQKTTLIGPGIFVAYAPKIAGLRLEGGGTWHYIDMNLKRGYQNGAGSAQSSGATHAQAVGLYGRIGWAVPIADHFALTPFAQYSWQQMKIDGYTESDGPFPASFDSRTDTSNKIRLGLEGQYAYNESLGFWTWAAWAHRFESKSSSMSGTLTGLSAFNYGGGPVDQNWGDAGVGARWRPYDGFQTFSRFSFGIDNQDHAEPALALTIGLGWDI